MECNQKEAMRAKELAEEKLGSGDFIGARNLLMKAQQLFPNLENLMQLLAICDVHCAAQNKINGMENWYGILQLERFADKATIKKQYRKLVLLLHPDKNKFPGAEAAFKLIGDANRLLTDQTKRSLYDIRCRIFSQVSDSKPMNRQSNTNPGRHYAPSDSVGNRKPTDFVFWTICQHCGFRYKCLRVFMNAKMRCSSCQRLSVAVNTGPYGVSPRSAPRQSQGPGHVPLRNSSSERTGGRSGNAPTKMDTTLTEADKLNNNHGGDQRDDTEVEKGSANDVAKVPKANEVRDSKANRKPEAAALKSTDRKRRKLVESEASESFENVGSVKVGDVSNKSSSLRQKQKVSYAEDGSNGGIVIPPMKLCRDLKSNADMKNVVSVGGLSGGANPDGSPAKAEKKTGSISLTVEKQSESCEGALPSGKVEEIDNENPKSEESPDPDFSKFDEKKRGFSVNQVWALVDSLDRMPRSYARIRKVSTNPLKLQMTWLKPLPATKNPEDEIDIPVACGKFESGETEESAENRMFSHQMHCIKQCSYYSIYPQKGETWALFRDWDSSWTTDPGKHKHKRPYGYELVEVLTDFREKADDDNGVCGIGVYFLEKAKGFDSVFVRATHGKVLACIFGPGEMSRFSHKVPSVRVNGAEGEGEGVPSGSFELDPDALPKDMAEFDLNGEMGGRNLDSRRSETEVRGFERGNNVRFSSSKECGVNVSKPLKVYQRFTHGVKKVSHL